MSYGHILHVKAMEAREADIRYITKIAVKRREGYYEKYYFL